MGRWGQINRCALAWRNSCCQGAGERGGDLLGSRVSAISCRRSGVQREGLGAGDVQLRAVSVHIFHLRAPSGVWPAGELVARSSIWAPTQPRRRAQPSPPRARRRFGSPPGTAL